MMATQIKRIAIENCRIINELRTKKLLLSTSIFPFIPVDIGTEINRSVGSIPTTNVTKRPNATAKMTTG